MVTQTVIRGLQLQNTPLETQVGAIIHSFLFTPEHFAPKADFDLKALLPSDLPLSLNHWPTSEVQSPSVAKFPGLRGTHGSGRL